MDLDIDNLRADLEEVRSAKRTFDTWLTTADTETRELVMSYIRDVSIAPNPLMVKLRKYDIPITPETIKKYREAAS